MKVPCDQGREEKEDSPPLMQPIPGEKGGERKRGKNQGEREKRRAGKSARDISNKSRPFACWMSISEKKTYGGKRGMQANKGGDHQMKGEGDCNTAGP